MRLLYHTSPRVPPQPVRGDGLLGGLDELHKALDLQASAADQGAVHVPLGHDLPGVIRFDGAAIEDACPLGKVVAPDLLEQIPDPADRVLRVLGCGRLARPDGPDGLVGEHESGTTGVVKLPHHTPDLPGDLLPHVAGVPLPLGLADADDGAETATSTPSTSAARGRSAAVYSCASRTVLFIFQLAAIIGRRAT